MMTVGCICCSRNCSATDSNSPAVHKHTHEYKCLSGGLSDEDSSRVSLTEDNNRSGSISNFLVLSATDLNHGFGCRMLDLDLLYRRTLVGHITTNKQLWFRPFTSLRMAFPSLVITIPPIGSSNIYEDMDGKLRER